MFNPNDKPEPPKAQASTERPCKVFSGDGAYVEFDGYSFKFYPEFMSRDELLIAIKAWLKAVDHDSRAYSFAEMEAFDLMEKAVAKAEGRS